MPRKPFHTPSTPEHTLRFPTGNSPIGSGEYNHSLRNLSISMRQIGTTIFRNTGGERVLPLVDVLQLSHYFLQVVQLVQKGLRTRTLLPLLRAIIVVGLHLLSGLTQLPLCLDDHRSPAGIEP